MWMDEEEHPEPAPNDARAASKDLAFRAWLRVRLALRPELASLLPDYTTRNAALDWYLEDAPRYVVWMPEETYRGKGFAAGAWQVRGDLVARDFPTAHREARRRLALAEDAGMTTLDDWLRADAAGTLCYPGEKGGADDLPAHLRATLARLAFCRRASWPRPCATCGASFRPPRSKARRCPACLARSKGGKGPKGANPTTIGATAASLVPLVPRATRAGDGGADGTDAPR